ncbi:DNA-directed DNA polymerase [mine drainage metagenome]|uniref:DNA-directed DNA polymerase n=2 Tax=mine drainage metagenome TaxID=410659 RepID=T0ZNM3_9ZZZZ
MGVVIYIDMDSFFAACEELRHPELKGKPFVVGTSSEAESRGVVQTASYEARKYGIKSGMGLFMAKKAYADLTVLKSDEPYYEGISENIMSILHGFGFPVEQNSVDEAAIDVGNVSYIEAARIAKEVKTRIQDRTHLPCTIGISFGKYFAKMVCDASKPDGFGMLKEQEVLPFLSGKPIGKLPGVGKKTEERLLAMGIDTIGDLAKSNLQALISKFGSMAIELYNLANGIDNSKVVPYSMVKSIGRERTLESDTNDSTIHDKVLLELSKAVGKDAAGKGFWFRAIGLKVRYSDFTQITRSRQLSHYSSSQDDIYRIAKELLKGAERETGIRKLGVRVFMLSKRTGQATL